MSFYQGATELVTFRISVHSHLGQEFCTRWPIGIDAFCFQMSCPSAPPPKLPARLYLPKTLKTSDLSAPDIRKVGQIGCIPKSTGESRHISDNKLRVLAPLSTRNINLIPLMRIISTHSSPVNLQTPAGWSSTWCPRRGHLVGALASDQQEDIFRFRQLRFLVSTVGIVGSSSKPPAHRLNIKHFCDHNEQVSGDKVSK